VLAHGGYERRPQFHLQLIKVIAAQRPRLIPQTVVRKQFQKTISQKRFKKLVEPIGTQYQRSSGIPYKIPGVLTIKNLRLQEIEFGLSLPLSF